MIGFDFDSFLNYNNVKSTDINAEEFENNVILFLKINL